MSVILKIIGISFIILSTASLGFFKASIYEGRVKDISWYIGTIGLIGQKIRFGMTNVSDTVKGIPASENYYVVASPFSVSLKKSRLKKTDEQVIKEFFEGLGTLDTQTEEKRCERYAGELQIRLKSATEKCHESSRLCKLLGLFSGVAISIILI